MLKCEELLVLCYLNANGEIVLIETSKCLGEVISIEFLLYLNTFKFRREKIPSKL